LRYALLVGALLLGASNMASAQGMEIHNRFGPSGTHFQLPAQSPSFLYEATICGGGTQGYKIQLDVYHNGVLKSSSTEIVAIPPTEYQYSSHVNMSLWGLLPGDCLTFTCKVSRLSDGAVLAVDHLFGDLFVPLPDPLPLPVPSPIW